MAFSLGGGIARVVGDVRGGKHIETLMTRLTHSKVGSVQGANRLTHSKVGSVQGAKVDYLREERGDLGQGGGGMNSGQIACPRCQGGSVREERGDLGKGV